jgi:hypothetical protein
MEAALVVQEAACDDFRLSRALFAKDFNERRRHQKALFYRMPARPLIKFLYMMIWRRAFLDGRAGVTYAVLQSIYEYFIVLKTRELRNAECALLRPSGYGGLRVRSAESRKEERAEGRGQRGSCS